MLESSVLCIVSAKKNSGGSKSMKKANKTVVATTGNVSRSLRSVRAISAVPHF
jgi:hypothetical protein